jgi:hypothetical protein
VSNPVSIVEWLDMYRCARLDPIHFAHSPAPDQNGNGYIRAGTHLCCSFGLSLESIVNRCWATIDGTTEDADALATRATLKIEVGNKIVFERPLNAILIGKAGLDVEERLARLERMMNVLVEQDSPAGEALRRLGGAKIDGSPLALSPPVLVRQHDQLFMGLTVQSDVPFSGPKPPVVDVSISGLCKKEVL